MGFNTSEMFPSKYLKAEELEEGEKRIVTIANVREEVFGQGREAQTKFVVEFSDCKDLVLNKTNCKNIEKLYGTNTDGWIGQRIVLFAMEVDSFGDIVRALRVHPQAPRPAPQNAPQAPQVAPMDNQPPQGQYAPSAPLNAQQAQARQQLNTGHQQPVAQSRGSFQPVNAYPADESDPFADDV